MFWLVSIAGDALSNRYVNGSSLENVEQQVRQVVLKCNLCKSNLCEFR